MESDSQNSNPTPASPSNSESNQITAGSAPQGPTPTSGSIAPDAPLPPDPGGNRFLRRVRHARRGGFYGGLLTVLAAAVVVVLVVLVSHQFYRVGELFGVRPKITISDAEITARAQKDVAPLLANDPKGFYKVAPAAYVQSKEFAEELAILDTGGNCTFTVDKVSKDRGDFETGQNGIGASGSVFCGTSRTPAYTLSVSYSGNGHSPEVYSFDTYNTRITSHDQTLITYLAAKPTTQIFETIRDGSGSSVFYNAEFKTYQNMKDKIASGQVGTDCTEKTASTYAVIGLEAGGNVSINPEIDCHTVNAAYDSRKGGYGN